MKLDRRDVLAALAAAGVTAGGGAAAYYALEENREDQRDESAGLAAEERETLVAAARVLYPGAVDNVDGFVDEYVDGLAGERPEKVAGIADAVAYLDEYARAWYDADYAELDEATRSDALRRMDADVSDADPAGSDVERVRYFVVDELLYALYTTPTGGQLVGIENPQGYPGGTQSYQRPPPERRDESPDGDG